MSFTQCLLKQGATVPLNTPTAIFDFLKYLKINFMADLCVFIFQESYIRQTLVHFDV